MDDEERLRRLEQRAKALGLGEFRTYLTPDAFDRLDALREVGGYKDLAGLFDDAVGLLEWFIEQKGNGKEVGSFGEDEVLDEVAELRSRQRSGGHER